VTIAAIRHETGVHVKFISTVFFVNKTLASNVIGNVSILFSYTFTFNIMIILQNNPEKHTLSIFIQHFKQYTFIS